MDFEEALDRFLKHLALSRTGSKDTDDAYRRDLTRFIEWLKDAKITSLEDVTKEDISQYVTDLRSGKIGGKPLSNASYARNLSSLRSFFRYLNQYEGIDNNPVAMFKSSNQRRKNHIIQAVRREYTVCQIIAEVVIRKLPPGKQKPLRQCCQNRERRC